MRSLAILSVRFAVDGLSQPALALVKVEVKTLDCIADDRRMQ